MMQVVDLNFSVSTVVQKRIIEIEIDQNIIYILGTLWEANDHNVHNEFTVCNVEFNTTHIMNIFASSK